MNVDPVELFGEAMMHRQFLPNVIEQLHRLPISAAIRRTTFIRWCDLVGHVPSEAEIRRVTAKYEA